MEQNIIYCPDCPDCPNVVRIRVTEENEMPGKCPDCPDQIPNGQFGQNVGKSKNVETQYHKVFGQNGQFGQWHK